MNGTNQQGLVRFAKRGDLADGRPDPELRRAHADGDAAGSGHGAHRLDGRMGPRQRAARRRGAARRDDRDLDGDQVLPDRQHDLVEPTAARLRRHDRAAGYRARPTGSGSPTRSATRSSGPPVDRDDPGRVRPPRVDRTPRACSPTARAGCGASARRAARRPTTGRVPNDVMLNSGEHRATSPARCSTSPTPRRTSPAPTNTAPCRACRRYWQIGPADVLARGVAARRRRPPAARSSASATSNTGRSGTNGNDRNLYMNNAGSDLLRCASRHGHAHHDQQSASYRDNQWHHVVGDPRQPTA